MTLAAVTLILVLVVAAVAVAAGANLKTRTAQTIVATWKCQDKLGIPRAKARSPWKPHSHAYRVWQLQTWSKRLSACRAVLAERARQWNWQAWLPANWVAVARCETGINFRHANSSYVSAFGIQRGAFNGAYDSDARKVGMPPWNDANPPSPWAQYQTALSHYRSFGDGWGCPGP